MKLAIFILNILGMEHILHLYTYIFPPTTSPSPMTISFPRMGGATSIDFVCPPRGRGKKNASDIGAKSMMQVIVAMMNFCGKKYFN